MIIFRQQPSDFFYGDVLYRNQRRDLIDIIYSITGLACLGFFLYAVRPVIWAWVLDLSPKELGGSAVSFFSASQSLLSSLSPVICGFIADRWGILTAFYFLAGTVLVANFVVLAIREQPKPASALAAEPA